jgi:hypothetical protein
MRLLKLALPLTGALAMTVSAGPTEPSSSSPGQVASPTAQCGQYLKIEEEGVMPVYSNGHYENLEVATHMIAFNNWSCGICMVFK